MVEAFAPYRADEAFAHAVHHGYVDCSVHQLDARVDGEGVELDAELGIVV